MAVEEYFPFAPKKEEGQDREQQQLVSVFSAAAKSLAAAEETKICIGVAADKQVQ